MTSVRGEHATHDLRPFVVEAPRPGVRGVAARIAETLEARELLGFLAWRDLTVRYKQTAIGLLWAALQPLLMVAAFTVFFGHLAGLATDNADYAIATFVALLPWQFVSYSVNAASHSVVHSQDLIKRVYFPRLLIPLAPLAVALTDFSAGFAILVLWIVIGSGVLTIATLWVSVYLLLALVTAVGVGCWLAALNVRFRDVQVAIPVLLQLWLFCTPIAYPSSVVPDAWKPLYAINPMVTVVDGFRSSMLGRPDLDIVPLVISVAVGVLVAVSGIAFFWRTEDTFADVV